MRSMRAVPHAYPLTSLKKKPLVYQGQTSWKPTFTHEKLGRTACLTPVIHLRIVARLEGSQQRCTGLPQVAGAQRLCRMQQLCAPRLARGCQQRGEQDVPCKRC